MSFNHRHCERSEAIQKYKNWIAASAFGLLAMTLLTLPVLAQETPRPAVHPAKEIEREKEQTETRKAELEKKAKEISSDLKSTQKDLVKIAEDVKENEANLMKLDKRIVDNRREQAEIEARLKKDKHSIGNLVLALERLDRTPPEAILARPGAPLETAQSAMLLQSILPDIYDRANALKKDLARLDTLLKELQNDQNEIKVTTASLTAKQDEIGTLLQRRKKLFSSTQDDIKEQEAALRQISLKAQNLQDLVTKIEKRQQEEEQARLALPDIPDEPAKPRARATPIPKAGSAQLPISGLIRTGYKQTDDIGAESQGLSIEGRKGALVVAPMGGVVRYAGYFKNYGEIIIVEHQKDYHSLIAGLGKIDTVVGQSVAAGEPLGSLPRSGDENPMLYYELRLKGAPVNPARKFAGL